MALNGLKLERVNWASSKTHMMSPVHEHLSLVLFEYDTAPRFEVLLHITENGIIVSRYGRVSDLIVAEKLFETVHMNFAVALAEEALGVKG